MPDRHLEASLLALFETAKDAMFIADLNGRFTHVNEAFLHLYCYTREEIIGQPIGAIKSDMHGDAFYQNIRDELNQQGAWSGELRNTSYSGEIIHIWTHIHKTATGYVGVQEDLREWDKNTRQIEHAARLESISTLAGGIAHEFNNILAGIQGHLYMVRRSIAEDDVKELERMLRINKLIERASGLVENMLVFSKQKQTLSRETSLASLLEDTVKLVTPSIPKLIQLELTIDHQALIVMANEIQLKQTLFELIANAGSAFDRMNEATLPAAPKISVHLQMTADNGAEITIADNGYGMNEHELRHCMDPFFTTKPVGQGTGLGLSSANSYIKQLGGSLLIDSTPRIGTTVHILLPLAHRTEQAEPLNRTVLLVDDDEGVRLSLHEVLVSSGYEVMLAADGIQALDQWQQHEQDIDAIIMDIVIPHMDGLEVAKNIRDSGSKVPICMMTGYSNQQLQPELKVHLFRKPVDPELLLQYLENQLVEKDSVGKNSAGKPGSKS